MIYTFKITGCLKNVPTDVEAAISAPTQSDAIQQIPAYARYFDLEGIDNIEYTGKYE